MIHQIPAQLPDTLLICDPDTIRNMDDAQTKAKQDEDAAARKAELDELLHASVDAFERVQTAVRDAGRSDADALAAELPSLCWRSPSPDECGRCCREGVGQTCTVPSKLQLCTPPRAAARPLMLCACSLTTVAVVVAPAAIAPRDEAALCGAPESVSVQRSRELPCAA